MPSMLYTALYGLSLQSAFTPFTACTHPNLAMRCFPADGVLQPALSCAFLYYECGKTRLSSFYFACSVVAACLDIPDTAFDKLHHVLVVTAEAKPAHARAVAYCNVKSRTDDIMLCRSPF